MQRCLEKSTTASSAGNIPMDKNPQNRINIHLQRRIIQGFSNIIRLVFLKRDTHSLKMIYITFFTLHAFIIMRKTHMCGNNFWIRRQIKQF